MIANMAALGAALCWAAGGLIAIGPVRVLGSIAFNRVRLTIVATALLVATTLMGGWQTLDTGSALTLALSGLLGIVVGDMALFWSLSRLGPRRNVVIYAANAPLTALLAYALLGEALGPWTILGVALVTLGVMLAVALRSGSTHSWEAIQGSLLAGVSVCLLAAVGQAAGSIIAKPVMAAGADPIASAAVRVTTAALMFTAIGVLSAVRSGAAVTSGGEAGVGLGGLLVPSGLTPKLMLQIAGNGLLGVGLGMTLLLVGLAHGNAGVVATLSALSPVLILPMMWLLTGQRPALGAWVGAAVAVAGVALIVNR
ncbi:drug/metabolite transporter (DMT)-like permease [Azospirillum lipoferum]|uniref:DMT family transporter n=1 Tax=Azospirillum lipoferum TaxID=193 RepID=A0A5A9GUJ5_AZOLI|nr:MULTISPECIES: DMT family transporter [Azospirillum]KAA0598003.1 DMT family transporter [Azospirillum lipoferum]MCP1609849.1 drug/metabolite transporter (DMT)-like permease [Azospirillum lipoferum]MDW5534658.1 DMT family transporter [Azospirillum sp. NL1]